MYKELEQVKLTRSDADGNTWEEYHMIPKHGMGDPNNSPKEELKKLYRKLSGVEWFGIGVNNDGD